MYTELTEWIKSTGRSNDLANSEILINPCCCRRSLISSATLITNEWSINCPSTTRILESSLTMSWANVVIMFASTFNDFAKSIRLVLPENIFQVIMRYITHTQMSKIWHFLPLCTKSSSLISLIRYFGVM